MMGLCFDLGRTGRDQAHSTMICMGALNVYWATASVSCDLRIEDREMDIPRCTDSHLHRVYIEHLHLTIIKIQTAWLFRKSILLYI